MSSQSQHSSAPISVQAVLANPMEMTLGPKAAHRIVLDAVVNKRRMRSRISPELVTALDLTVENIDWVSPLPSAEVWIEVLGRHSFHRAVIDPSITNLVIGWIVLNDLDLVVDGDPAKLRRRHPDYIIVEV